jgi:hypothetical protein
MSDQHEDIDIHIVLQNGQVVNVEYRGVTVRAIVEDYDVEFPFEPAEALHKNTETGEYFTRKIV